MQKIITTAACDWNHSIIERDTLNKVFASTFDEETIGSEWLDACKLVLVKQTTCFAWEMFGRCLSTRQLSSARKHLEKFVAISGFSPYRPSAPAVKSLMGWLAEEERRSRTHRPIDYYASLIFPWLISFYRTASPGNLNESECGRFIDSYLSAFRDAVHSPWISIPDPEGESRKLTLPSLLRSPETTRHTVHNYITNSLQYDDLIRSSVLDQADAA